MVGYLGSISLLPKYNSNIDPENVAFSNIACVATSFPTHLFAVPLVLNCALELFNEGHAFEKTRLLVRG